jgi:ribosome-associated heat shock protein Hsp15
VTESANAETQIGPRIDKWLWFARFFKSRALAQATCAAGRVRVNRQPAIKPHYRVKLGDVLTFPQGHNIRVVRIQAFGERRGPAPEAQTLYEDLAPPEAARRAAPKPAPVAARDPGAGRPTKAARRAIDRLRDPT